MFACGYVRWFGCAVVVAATAVAGCRDSEPPRSYYRDMGTDARPLLPGAPSWHDAGVKDGAAEWHQFRSPAEMAAEGDRGGDGETGDPGPEGEIRELIEEYNAAVADEDYEEAAKFFLEDQADAVQRIVAVLPEFAESVKALGEASGEVAPQTAEGIAELLRFLDRGEILKLQVDSLTMVSNTKATGRLPERAALTELLRAMGHAQIPSEVRFQFDDEDEYWFIDSPALAAALSMLPMLEQSIGVLDALVAGLKSGQVSADAFAGELGVIGEMLGRLKESSEDPDDSEDVPTDDTKNDAEDTE